MGFIEVGVGDMNSIHLDQDKIQWHALVYATVNFRVPLKTEFLDQLSRCHLLTKVHAS
jgi:hypothetical protein